MGKVTDFGHPVVELKFKTVDTGDGYLLLAQVHDEATGEILIGGDRLSKIAEWLNSMGYKWMVGSQGRWSQ